MNRIYPPAIDRMMSRTEVDLVTGCWNWTGAKGCRTGYGRIFVDGRPEYAHRFSYSYHKGEIPAGMYVCHTCDNVMCVNPDHLFLGTAKDNTADMLRKGRHGRFRLRGKDHPNARLTEEQVAHVFMNRSNSHSDLARAYGVSVQTIWKIRNGGIWSSITSKLQAPVSGDAA